MRSLAVLAVLARVAAADCDDQADCILREEATKLFKDGKYAEAAEKFKASAAAKPTARAYLGYAQALEQIGRVALAYDAIREAKQLSEKEVAAHPDDVDITSRAGRIDYVTGEIRAKVGLVRLSLPSGVSPKTLASVQRKGEGDLDEPLDAPIAVAPDGQKLIALLRDGRSVPFTVDVGAGLEATAIIPINGATGDEEPAPPEPPHAIEGPRLRALLLGGLIPSRDRNGGWAWGGILGAEYRPLWWLALRAGAGYFEHEGTETEQLGIDPPHEFGGNEQVIQVGARTANARFFAGIDLGIWRFEEIVATATDFPGVHEHVVSTYVSVVPAVGFRYKRFEARLALVCLIDLDVYRSQNAQDADLDSVRGMATIGVALP